MDHRTKNARAWNRLVQSGTKFAAVATDEELAQPLRILDGRGWLPPSVAGLDVLCLAAGGGWQSLLYAAAGARVTVVDLSAEMLRIDDREANRHGFSLRLVEATMEELPLPDASFDIVHQPVSTCYVPDIAAVYAEVARVLRDRGLYISQHKQPQSLQVTHRTPEGQYVVGLEYYRGGALPSTEDETYREAGTVEYLHRWDQLLGQLCEAGFVIEAFSEPYRADAAKPVGHPGHRGRFLPPYVRMKARRIERTQPKSRLWTP